MNQTGIITFEAFENVDMRAGTITAVEDFREARKRAYKVSADFGPAIGVKRTSAQITTNYSKEDLVGRQIIGVINLPTKQIGPMISQFLIVGFYRDDATVVLAIPDKNVPNGARLA